MADPYYWYWTTYPTTRATQPSPSLTEVLVVMLIPLLIIALCLGFALWDHHDRRSHGRRLTRRELRALAAIEDALRDDDPDLARRFADFAANTPSPERSPRRTETAT